MSLPQQLALGCEVKPKPQNTGGIMRQSPLHPKLACILFRSSTRLPSEGLAGTDPEIFLRGGSESKFCKMKGIHSQKIQH